MVLPGIRPAAIISFAALMIASAVGIGPGRFVLARPGADVAFGDRPGTAVRDASNSRAAWRAAKSAAPDSRTS